MGAVAGVDHPGPDPARVGEPVRRAAGAVPDDDRVGAHRLEGERGVLEALALARLEPLAEKLMTSALSRLAAASKEIRVRVESSKNRLTTVRPRSAGSFLIGRSASERISSAVVRTSSASSRVRSAALSRCRFIGSSDSLDRDRVDAVDRRRARTLTRSTSEVGQVLADEVGPDRQLAVAAVDQDREPDRARPADVVERVERGPDGAAAEEHVVDEDDDLAVDAAGRDLGRQQRPGRLEPQVVAVHRHVERADRHVVPLDGGDPLGDPVRPAGRRGWGCRAGRGRRRPCCARGSRGRCGSGPARCRGRRGPTRPVGRGVCLLCGGLGTHACS